MREYDKISVVELDKRLEKMQIILKNNVNVLNGYMNLIKLDDSQHDEYYKIIENEIDQIISNIDCLNSFFIKNMNMNMRKNDY